MASAAFYDDEEEDLPVAFEQDEDSDDFGDGIFIKADGSRIYGSDPELAGELEQAGKATLPEPPDERTAAIDEATGETRSDTPAYLTDDPAMPDQFPDMAEPEPEPEPAAAAPLPPATPEPPRAQLPALPPGGRLPVAGMTRSGTAESSSSESSGSTRNRSAMPQDVYDTQRQRLGETTAASVRTQQESDAETQRYYADVMRQNAVAGAAEEARVAAAQAQNAKRQQAVLAKQKEISERKEDPFKDSGIGGRLMAGFAVFLGGISSGMLGGPNQALQAVQDNRREAIEAQRGQKNSELHALERELGSLEAAVPALEARMTRKHARDAEAALAGERSMQARQKGAQYIAALNAEAAAKESEMAKAYYGTIAEQQAQQASSSMGSAVGETAARPVAVGAGAGGAGGAAAAPTAAAVVKEMLATRDLAQLQRSNLTEDEYAKQATAHTEKAQKASDYKDSALALAREMGITVTEQGGKPVADSKAKPDSGFGLWGTDSGTLASDKRNAVTRRYSRLTRADTMGMLREPAAKLQQEFAEASKRPFLDSDALPQVQFFLDLAQQAEHDAASGFNPIVVKDYRATTGRASGTGTPSLKRNAGP